MLLKTKKILVLLSILVVFGIVIWFLVYLLDSKGTSLSLKEIKDRLGDTAEIRVCKLNSTLNKPCGKSTLVRVINDKDTLSQVVNITNSLEENFTQNTLLIKDGYTIYFIDNKGKVIVSADFGFHYVIKTRDRQYKLSEESNQILCKLLVFSD